jgi:hypothetical protein
MYLKKDMFWSYNRSMIDIKKQREVGRLGVKSEAQADGSEITGRDCRPVVVKCYGRKVIRSKMRVEARLLILYICLHTT